MKKLKALGNDISLNIKVQDENKAIHRTRKFYQTYVEMVNVTKDSS